MTDPFEVAYDRVFDTTCASIESRRHDEASFRIHDLEKLLESQYVAEGLKWTGRNSPQEIRRTATIAAYEHVLAEWRAESSKETS
ncbi:MAG: hypothetical protein HN909_09220 [Phycisphaerales bacterium]|jgi:hypothetical protein|nr:hypothetical protein [Phycisphaerales bacterium]MBT7171930.1 hypothetical protein [Phycisphaerales bacterium]